MCINLYIRSPCLLLMIIHIIITHTSHPGTSTSEISNSRRNVGRLQPLKSVPTSTQFRLNMRLIVCIAVITTLVAAQQPCFDQNGNFCPPDPCDTDNTPCPTTDNTFTCCASRNGYIFCYEGNVQYVDCGSGWCSPDDWCVGGLGSPG